MKQKQENECSYQNIGACNCIHYFNMCFAGIFAYRSINEGMVQMGVEQAKMAAQIAADGANSIYISEFGP